MRRRAAYGLAVLAVLALLGAAMPVALGAEAGAAIRAGDETNTATSDEISAALIPSPKTLVVETGSFVISSKTVVLASAGAESERIARYFAELTSRTTPVQLRVSGSRAAGRAIAFNIDPAAPSGEGYSLKVSSNGVAIRAREPRGLFYGAISLWQLMTANPVANSSTSISLPAVRIEDGPAFAWRGLMLDVARHYLPPAELKRLLDQMALHKLNTFHWHLTDDQGWRIQILKYPLLTDVGAWRVPAGAGPASDIDASTGKARVYGGFYTQDEVRDIVRYAAERFITVVPEIEMPGHAQAAIAAYPQLGTEGPRPPVSSDWGVHNYLYNVDETTFSFLEDVLSEVMALFPGQYIHIGGDEAAKDRWRASPRIQQRMRELGVTNETALQSYFTHRIEKFIRGRGRKLIGWDEILEGGLRSAATVMSWRGEAGAIEAVKGGHDVVMAPSPDLYLDYLQSSAADEPPGRPRYVTLEDMYRFKVVPSAIQGEAARHVLGAQINAWTEHMRTPERVQHAIFPRAAAFAESVWSNPDRRDWPGFVARLPAQFARYEKLNVRYARTSVPKRPVSDHVALLSRNDDELESCSNKLPLRLEDDAPRDGVRAVFNVDILDPCWIFKRADLSHATAIAASVGQVPFNFQVGEDVKKIPLYPPQSPEGELEVRLDSCEGERIAVLPLAPAVSNAVTMLPHAKISSRPGVHDLCLRFTRRAVDPIWAIDSVRVVE